eukprot:5056017-Pyramimonas_sp.AAC.1
MLFSAVRVQSSLFHLSVASDFPLLALAGLAAAILLRGRCCGACLSAPSDCSLFCVPLLVFRPLE